MFVVLLSTIAGFGLCYALGWKKTYANEPIPLIMLGIGVDDIFVIINSLDQVSFNLPTTERLKLALRHAGPTISITSLTNALAFLAAMSSQLVALQSFSIFSFSCILLLYTAMMTLYLPVVYWDTQRVAKRNKECCGLLCCAEDSKLFCKGRFLAQSKHNYSFGDSQESVTAVAAKESQDETISINQVNHECSSSNQIVNQSDFDASKDVETAEAELEIIGSSTELFLREKVAGKVVSKGGRICVLSLYTLLIPFVLYGCFSISIRSYRDNSLDDSMFIYPYSMASEKYFDYSRTFIMNYMERTNLDFASREAQIQMYVFNEAYARCDGCRRSWHPPNTLQSWFIRLREWIENGKCPHIWEGE